MGSMVAKKVKVVLTRPIKSFNIENRAQRVLEKQKREIKPAPRHPSSVRELEIARQQAPDFLEKHYTKDPALDDRLKNVFVKSHDPVDPETSIPTKPNPKRPLPQDRSAVPFFQFGTIEPVEVPPGRISLRSALTLLAQHQSQPEQYTAEQQAITFNLKLEDTNDLIEYLKTFQLYVPKQIEADDQDVAPHPVAIVPPVEKLSERKTELLEKNDEENDNVYGYKDIMKWPKKDKE